MTDAAAVSRGPRGLLAFLAELQLLGKTLDTSRSLSPNFVAVWFLVCLRV